MHPINIKEAMDPLLAETKQLEEEVHKLLCDRIHFSIYDCLVALEHTLQHYCRVFLDSV